MVASVRSVDVAALGPQLDQQHHLAHARVQAGVGGQQPRVLRGQPVRTREKINGGKIEKGSQHVIPVVDTHIAGNARFSVPKLDHRHARARQRIHLNGPRFGWKKKKKKKANQMNSPGVTDTQLFSSRLLFEGGHLSPSRAPGG